MKKSGDIWVCPQSDHVVTRFFFVYDQIGLQTTDLNTQDKDFKKEITYAIQLAQKLKKIWKLVIFPCCHSNQLSYYQWSYILSSLSNLHFSSYYSIIVYYFMFTNYFIRWFTKKQLMFDGSLCLTWLNVLQLMFVVRKQYLSLPDTSQQTYVNEWGMTISLKVIHVHLDFNKNVCKFSLEWPAFFPTPFFLCPLYTSLLSYSIITY